MPIAACGMCDTCARQSHHTRNANAARRNQVLCPSQKSAKDNEKNACNKNRENLFIGILAFACATLYLCCRNMKNTKI